MEQCWPPHAQNFSTDEFPIPLFVEVRCFSSLGAADIYLGVPRPQKRPQIRPQIRPKIRPQIMPRVVHANLVEIKKTKSRVAVNGRLFQRWSSERLVVGGVARQKKERNLCSGS